MKKMAKNNPLDTTIRIPVITDLVSPGDPEIIRKAREYSAGHRRNDFERTLKSRIDDLKSATGQDEYGKLARAHAIRSESNNRKSSAAKKNEKEETIAAPAEEHAQAQLPEDTARFVLIREHAPQ